MQRIILYIILLVSLCAQNPNIQKFEKLQNLVGNWQGQQVFHPCEWWPKGDKGTSEIQITKTLSDNFLQFKFRSKRQNRPLYQAKNMLTIADQKIQYWEFDNLGYANFYSGKITKNKLILEHHSQKIHIRLTYNFISKNSYSLKIEMGRKKQKLTKIISSFYTRITKKEQENTKNFSSLDEPKNNVITKKLQKYQNDYLQEIEKKITAIIEELQE